MKKLLLCAFNLFVGILVCGGANLLAWGVTPVQKLSGVAMYLCGIVLCVVGAVKIDLK